MINKYKELNEVAIRRFLNNYQYYSEEYEKVKIKVLKEFRNIEIKNNDLDQYRKVLWNMICDKVILFNRDILIYIAEFLREMVCMNKFPVEKLDSMMQINEIAIIMQKAIFENWGRFVKKRWYVNSSYLNELKELIYLYILVTENILKAKINNIEIEFENLLDTIEDKDIDNYFQEYDKYFRTLKLEHEIIENSVLNEYLDNKKMLPHQIRRSGNYAIESTLGFNYDDLEILKRHFRLELNNYETLNHHFCIEKNMFLQIFSKYINMSKVENVLKYLTINNLFTAEKSPTERQIELRCISEYDGKLYFGLYNLFECLDIFENISFSGHFMKELGIAECDKNKFSKVQEKFSTFFSYKVADLLDSNGYLLPKKDGIIQAELCEIEIGNSKVLKFKDIDVLAADTKNRILYHFELKYYKLDLNYKRLKSDKFKHSDFNLFRERNNILDENKVKILKNLFGIANGEDYKISPVLITSRVNFKSRDNIPYYNFESFKEKLQLKEIL